MRLHAALRRRGLEDQAGEVRFNKYLLSQQSILLGRKSERRDSGDVGWGAQQEGRLWPPPQTALQPPHAWT